MVNANECCCLDNGSSRSAEKETAGTTGIVSANEPVAVNTNVTFIGHDQIPIIVLDNVLPKLKYTSLLSSKSKMRVRAPFNTSSSDDVNDGKQRQPELVLAPRWCQYASIDLASCRNMSSAGYTVGFYMHLHPHQHYNRYALLAFILPG